MYDGKRASKQARKSGSGQPRGAFGASEEEKSLFWPALALVVALNVFGTVGALFGGCDAPEQHDAGAVSAVVSKAPTAAGSITGGGPSVARGADLDASTVSG